MSINVGILGMGYMGRTHYEAYQQLPDVRVRAVCDNKLARAKGDLSGTGGNVLKEGVERIAMEGVYGTTNWREVVELARRGRGGYLRSHAGPSGTRASGV